jgi:hypothetical protein
MKKGGVSTYDIRAMVSEMKIEDKSKKRKGVEM